MADTDLLDDGQRWTECGCRKTNKDHIPCKLCGRHCAARSRSATALKRHPKARPSPKSVRSLYKRAAPRTLPRARKTASRSPASISDCLCARKEATLGTAEQPSSRNRYVLSILSGKKQKAETSNEPTLLSFGGPVTSACSHSQTACTFRDESLPTPGDRFGERDVTLSMSVYSARAKNNTQQNVRGTCISSSSLADGKAMEKSGSAKRILEGDWDAGKSEVKSVHRVSLAKRQDEELQVAIDGLADEDCSICRLVRPESWKTFGQPSDDGGSVACKLCGSQFPFPNGSVDVFIRHVAHMHVNHKGTGSTARRRNSEVLRRPAVDFSVGPNVGQGTPACGSGCVGEVKEGAESSFGRILTSGDHRRSSYPSEGPKGVEQRKRNESLHCWRVHGYPGASSVCFPRNWSGQQATDKQAVLPCAAAAAVPKLATVSELEMANDNRGSVDRKTQKRGTSDDDCIHAPDVQGPAPKVHRNLISVDVHPAQMKCSSPTLELGPSTEARRSDNATPQLDKKVAVEVRSVSDGGLLCCRKCDKEVSDSAKILPCFHILCSLCFEQLTKGKSLRCNVCQADVDVEATVHFSISAAQQSASARKCVICENIASHFCENCEDNLCERCSQAHLLVKYTRDHVVRQAHSPKTAEVCSQHSATISKFCLTCGSSACEQCVREMHAEHDTEIASNLVAKVKQEMVTVRKRANDLHDELEKAIKKVTQQLSAWEEHKCWILTLLSTFFHRVHEMILDREVNTVGKLKGEMNKESGALHRRRRQYELLDSRAQLIASLCGMVSLQNDPKPLLCAQNLFNTHVKVLGEQIPTRVPEVKPYVLSLPFKEIKELLDRLDQSVTRAFVNTNSG
uniref:RING-type domain-containing protein n=1 Tax=Trichuris muris TaxID=70415 RepID=A0A5S6QPX6_TRIMR